MKPILKSFINRRVRLSSEINNVRNLGKIFEYSEILTREVSEIVFEGNIIGRDGCIYKAVGLINCGEYVIDERGNLVLFPFISENGDILHNFEMVEND